MTAQGTEARRGETAGLDAKRDGPVGTADAPNPLYQEGYSMTDTTDQQAMTVAQEDVVVALREINEMAAGVGDIFPNDATAVVAIGQTASAALDVFDARIVGNAKAYVEAMAVVAKDPPAALSRLVSVSSASAEEVGAHFFPDAAAKLHKLITGSNVEGALPDDVRALVIAAREFWDDENSGTVRSRALDKALEAFSSRVPYDDQPTPEPVPATNQAGEVEIVGWLEAEQKRIDDEAGDYLMDTADCINVIREKFAALATQPATSQEGGVRQASERLLLAMTTRALRGRDHVPSMRDEQDAASDLRAALAATPTPPTLSEDLREALEPFTRVHPHKNEAGASAILIPVTVADVRRARAALAMLAPSVFDDLRQSITQALQCTPHIQTRAGNHGQPVHTIIYDCGDPWEILRAALAQVKAS